jgi:hypothetical protein
LRLQLIQLRNIVDDEFLPAEGSACVPKLKLPTAQMSFENMLILQAVSALLPGHNLAKTMSFFL